jgi:hypothetical protein
MQCPDCHAAYVEEDLYCRQCGADLPLVTQTAIVSRHNNLPAVLYNPQIPRRVAAGVGALAVGVGIELLRRNLLARLTHSARPVEANLPALSGLREILQPQQEKSLKLPKGYEVHETVVYMRRVIRRRD